MEREYFDSQGRSVSLGVLCSLEPEWASSRIGTLEAELGEAKQERARYGDIVTVKTGVLERELAEARDHIEWLNAWLLKHHGTCDPDALRAWGEIHAAIDAGKEE